MKKQFAKVKERLIHRRIVGLWTSAAKAASTADLDALSEQRQRARQLKGRLEEVMHIADQRLALPRIGSTSFPTPPGTQWSWRPNLWRGPLAQKGIAAVPTQTQIGQDVSLFHDCGAEEITIRQIRNTDEDDLAPFALRMDVLNFEGSFLSLVVDLPLDAAAGVSRRHVVRMTGLMDVEKKIEVFARLNIKHGPNTEQILAELSLERREIMAEFDLAYADINEQRVERMWLDLIFEGPAMNQVIMRDLTFCRYPRAEL